MKKTLKIIGIILSVILAIMIIIPMLFKGEIEELIKEETNKRVNATIDFKDIGLNLFTKFPNLSLSINELSIVNAKPFEGDTLLSAKSLGATIDLRSLITSEKIKIKSVSFDEPHFLMFILKEGTANYNIMKESAEAVKDAAKAIKDSTESSFNIALESYAINNGMIAFIDKRKDLIVALKNVNHHGSGEFSQDDFIIYTQTAVDELTYEYGGVTYLNRVNSDLSMELHANIPSFKFTLKDNQLRLNNLFLKFDGSIAMPNEDLDLDLTYSASRTEFKDIISLIPAIYGKNFEKIESSGSMELTGNVKGISNKKSLPSFEFNLNVSDGKFQYPDLPMPVSNVNMQLTIKNPGGIVDNTIVDLKKLHIELGQDPFDIKMLMKKPESGPYVEAKMKGVVNLKNIKKTLELEDITNLEGIIETDVEMKGIIPSEDDTNYEDIEAKGEVTFKNIVYQTIDLPDAVNISNASLTLTPRFFKLNNMEMKIGESDLKAVGSLRNFISYALSNGTLLGDLNVSSKYLNVNPFLTESSRGGEKTTAKTEQQLSAVEIPENLDLTLDASFNRLIYDNLDIKNVKGKILVKDKVITMEKLKMNLLGGSMIANGTYKKKDAESNPDISFDISINDFGIKETYDSFISVSTLAPIAKYIQGNFGAEIELNSTLDNNLIPDWKSFNSTGNISLKDLEIKDFKPFTTLGSVLNISELSNPKIQNTKITYRVSNGRFYISPVSYKIKEYNITLVGSSGMDQTLDYVMEVDIPAGEINKKANSAISSLLGKDIKVLTADKIKVNANIGGTINNPKISTSAEDVASDVASSAIKQAEVQAKKEAEAYADSLKKEAEKKLKEEEKKQEEELKKKLEEEAKKLLNNLFKKG